MENFQEIMDFIVNNQSTTTVGKVCKRFELAIKNKDSLSITEVQNLKHQIKELLYEDFRNIRDFIKTGKIIFEFKQKKE